MFFGQPGGYLLCSETDHIQPEYTPNHRCRFIVHDPAFAAIRAFMYPYGGRPMGTPAFPRILLLIRRFLLMSRLYHSLKMDCLGKV